MIYPSAKSNTSSDTKQWVRRNAGSAAIAAVLMLYFGFERLIEPTGTDLFSKASLVFFYTVRFGGIAMAVIAVWSWTGHATVLIVDAFVSIGIGALLALTGVCMILDGGDKFQSILNIVFGWMFYASGVSNWGTYREIMSSRKEREVFPAQPPIMMNRENSFHQVASTPVDLPQPESTPEYQSAIRDEPMMEEQTATEEPPVIEESPGGFLASFANKKDPPQE